LLDVVESVFYTKLKKFDGQEGKKDKLFADHVTQVCKAHDRVILLPPAGARTCKANRREIEGEHWARCVRVRRYKEEHMLTECQGCGPGAVITVLLIFVSST